MSSAARRLRPWGEAGDARPREGESMTTHTPAVTISPCLAFPGNAEEAVRFYVSVFPGARITKIVRAEAGGRLPAGTLLHASFEVAGQTLTALDGDASFTFGHGFSLVATCATQAELDDVWAKLAAGGK